MRVATLRTVDRWVGIPVCLLLTLHRRLFGGPVPKKARRRILFVKLAEQGSTVLAQDALRRAIAQVGRDNVFFLAFEENRSILDALGVIPPANVVTIDVRSLPAAMRSLISAVHRLRRLRLDAAVDLEFFSRSSAILTFLSGAGSRVGLHSYSGEGPWRGDLMTHRLTFNPYLHTSDLFVLMIEALDHPIRSFPAFAARRPEPERVARSYEPPAEDLAAARALLRNRLGPRGEADPIILLNANSGDLLPLRRWDPSRYVELARRLLDALPEVCVVLTGDSKEIADVEGLAVKISSPRCVSVAGRTTLPQLLALYHLSRVLVTNDSGPAHFASLTPIGTVTLFGPETPSLFAARTGRNRMLSAGIACSPCVSAFNGRVSQCHNNICMQLIPVDDVFEATMTAYRESADRL